MNNFIGFLLIIIIGCVVVVGCQEKGMFGEVNKINLVENK